MTPDELRYRIISLAELRAEKDRRIREVWSRRPPWWKFWARPSWRAEYDAVRVMSLSDIADDMRRTAMLRGLYPATTMERMVDQPRAAMALLQRDRRPRQARYVQPVSYDTDDKEPK